MHPFPYAYDRVYPCTMHMHAVTLYIHLSLPSAAVTPDQSNAESHLTSHLKNHSVPANPSVWLSGRSPGGEMPPRRALSHGQIQHLRRSCRPGAQRPVSADQGHNDPSVQIRGTTTRQCRPGAQRPVSADQGHNDPSVQCQRRSVTPLGTSLDAHSNSQEMGVIGNSGM